MTGPVTMTASDVRRIEALVLDWHCRFAWDAIEAAAEREQIEQRRAQQNEINVRDWLAEGRY